MAYSNPTFNPRVAEYENMTAPQQGYGSQHGRTDNTQCESNKLGDDENTYQELPIAMANIYQYMTSPRQIEIVTNPMASREKYVRPGIPLPPVNESVTDEPELPRGANRATTNIVQHHGEKQISNTHLYGDPRCCMCSRVFCLLVILFLVLFLGLSFLFILHIAGEFGPQHHQQTRQGEFL